MSILVSYSTQFFYYGDTFKNSELGFDLYIAIAIAIVLSARKINSLAYIPLNWLHNNDLVLMFEKTWELGYIKVDERSSS